MTRDKEFGQIANSLHRRQDKSNQDRQLKESLQPDRILAEQEQRQGCVHHTWTEDEETIVQVTFIGPTGATFVNPADDPRNTEKEQASK